MLLKLECREPLGNSLFFPFPCWIQGVSQCATEALVPDTFWKLVFFLSCLLQGVSQCAPEAQHPFFRRGPTRMLTCLLQVCDFALVAKIFMTTSVLLKLPCLPCRPNALFAPEVLSSGKYFRFVLPGLSLRSIAWCSHFESFHGETSGGKDNTKENKREKSTERVLQDYAENIFPPPLNFLEFLCNFGVCGSWAIRRMPHLQPVSDRSHRADRDDDVGLEAGRTCVRRQGPWT